MESTLTTEEILKEHKKWKYDRTDRNGTRYFINYTCGRCGGRGGWEGWPDFTCYECGGSGIGKGEIIKVYTPEHAAKLAARREANARKREAERLERAINERGERLTKIGFGKEGDTYVIYRAVGNTYPIKDELKALGCKYSPVVGWFAPHALNGYETQRMEERDVLQEGPYIEWKSKEEVAPILQENLQAAAASPSKHIGSIGERLDLNLHIDRAFEGKYHRNDGWYGTTTTYMYLMHDKDGNIFKWSTSCFYEENQDVHFRATVKDHTDYKDKFGVITKQTVLTRCRKVEDD